MNRTLLTFAALFGLALFGLTLSPGVAEAKYRIPSPPEVIGKSSLIVIGEVESVAEGEYSVRVVEVVARTQADPKLSRGEEPLATTIKVFRRPPTRMCTPQDPLGIEKGTRWVWFLEAQGAGKPYRSWISSPFQVVRDGAKVQRVRYSRITPANAQRAGKVLPGPSLKTFVGLIQAYRKLYTVTGRDFKLTGSAQDLEAFRESSPYAAELLRRTPKPRAN